MGKHRRIENLPASVCPNCLNDNLCCTCGKKREEMTEKKEVILAEQIVKKVNKKLKNEYGKPEGISSRQIFALIDVLVERWGKFLDGKC